MRLLRGFFIALVPIVLAGCLSDDSQSRFRNPLPLLGGSIDPDSAMIQYVIVERTAGGEDINRRAWDRVDEQVLPFETRSTLEAAGLRVGTTGESTAGALRKLIDDPRTSWGHRARTFALDHAAPLPVSSVIERAEFTMPAADGGQSTFKRNGVVLGFDITVRDGADGTMLVKFVPRARYHDPSQLIPADVADRGLSTDLFPAAGFEIALLPNEYLVVGTDSYWAGRFGHVAFTAEGEERQVQRLLVLRATRTRPGRGAPPPLSTAGHESQLPPLVSQAGAIRAAKP
jgi:hypothetical protein